MERNVSQLESSINLKSILVIDDEKLVRESITIYLEDSGYKVIEAVDGQQGLSLFCEFQPDLVLCDLKMPNMDGMTLLANICELSPNTPIIIVSGAGQIKDVVKALRLGAVDFLVKPITDMAILENAIENALRRSHLEEENLHYKDELEQANIELEKNLDLLQKDQDAGRQAQQQLFPPTEMNISEYHFYHKIIPSLNLSGDFVDYFKISNRYTGFYFADVSGHGSAAAFVTMMLKSLINQPLRQFKSEKNQCIINPKDLLKYLNTELLNANLGKHITLFYAVIDCENNTMEYSVAGQYPAPLLMQNNTISFLKEDGFPLGLFDWVVYKNKTIKIYKDFKLLMVSDGWLELKSENDKPASEAELLEFTQNNLLNIDAFMKPFDNYKKANLPDDITIFIVKKEQD